MSSYKKTIENFNKNDQIKRTLREFYKLDTQTQFETQLSALDVDNFNLEQYIQDATHHDPQTLLNLENTLIQEIRSLECEKKILVYNNYTKLLSISDIIQKMKNDAEPMKPVINMLKPALAHIGALSASLSDSQEENAKNL